MNEQTFFEKMVAMSIDNINTRKASVEREIRSRIERDAKQGYRETTDYMLRGDWVFTKMVLDDLRAMGFKASMDRPFTSLFMHDGHYTVRW